MKVFVKTYGCTFNKRDGQAIEGVLAKAGFSLINNEKEADKLGKAPKGEKKAKPKAKKKD